MTSKTTTAQGHDPKLQRLCAMLASQHEEEERIAALTDAEREAEALAAKLERRSEKRCRDWMLRNATIVEVHTSEDYPRRLETLGLVERASRDAYFGHAHVLRPTELFSAVVHVWAKQAAARLTEQALDVLREATDDGPIEHGFLGGEIESLHRMGAIEWTSRRVSAAHHDGYWRRTSFGWLVQHVSGKKEMK